MTTVGYITVVDPGFGDLITRYGARAHLEGDRALGARLCSLSSLVWLGLGILGLPLLLWAIPAWIPHLHGAARGARGRRPIRFFYWGYAYTVAGCLIAIMSSRLTADRRPVARDGDRRGDAAPLRGRAALAAADRQPAERARHRLVGPARASPSS